MAVYDNTENSLQTSSQHQDELPTPPRRKCLSATLSMESQASNLTVLSSASAEEPTDFASLTFSASRFIHKKQRRDKFQHNYKLGPLIGKGGFGSCFKCTHIGSGVERACKLLHKSDNRKDNKSVVHEFKLLSQLDHPNLLKVYELYEDKKYFFIITDLYEGGDLFDLVEKEGPLNEQEVAMVIQRLLSCVNYLHQNGIVHRDIKPENVILTGNDFNTLKLIDFGLARQERPNQAFCSIVGSPFYVSPQVVNAQYNRKCDIWALGVIAYVLLCGKPPFDGGSDHDILEKIQVGYIHFDYAAFDVVTPDCTAYIRYLMTYEEDQRPSALEALKHPWLEQLKSAKAVASVKNMVLKKDVESALESLQRFQSRDCKLKQATAALLSCRFVTVAQRERLDAVFRALDRSHTGTLSVHDLQLAFADHLNIYLTQEEIQQQLWPDINYGGSGAVSYSEFVAVVSLEGRSSAAKVQEIYEHLDQDQKGFLNARDLQIGFRIKPETADLVCSEMIAQVAKDEDDEVIPRAVFERAVGKTIVAKKKTSSKPVAAAVVPTRKPLRRTRSLAAGAA